MASAAGQLVITPGKTILNASVRRYRSKILLGADSFQVFENVVM